MRLEHHTNLQADDVDVRDAYVVVRISCCGPQLTVRLWQRSGLEIVVRLMFETHM